MVNANTCRVTGGSAAWISLISLASLGKAPTAKCTRQRTRTQVTERFFTAASAGPPCLLN